MIYTKKGDKGKTSMFSLDAKKQERVSKASLRVHAIGAIDEINSYLGIANSFCRNKTQRAFVSDVQRNLFTIGSILSKAPLSLPSDALHKLEREIDRLEEKLPPLSNFLMPDGSKAAVHFMYARALARRAERRVVALSKSEEVSQEVLAYLNRLSDYLFMVFREENERSGKKETLWIARKR